MIYSHFQSELPGFYDPCFGEEKLLRIDYEFRERSYTVVVADNEDIKLPENGQTVQSWIFQHE